MGSCKSNQQNSPTRESTNQPIMPEGGFEQLDDGNKNVEDFNKAGD